jgi:hypothetical protein
MNVEQIYNVLHGCKTWSLTLSEEHRLMFFERGCCEKYLNLRVSYRRIDIVAKYKAS